MQVRVHNEKYLPTFVEPQIIKGLKEYDENTILRIIIESQEYIKCSDFAKVMWATKKYKTKKKISPYDIGLANTIEDTTRVERTGLLGEMGFAKIFNVPINLEYKEFGEKVDFLLFRNTGIDIKSATRPYGVGLVRATSDAGFVLPLHNELFVFIVITEKAELQQAIVDIIGFATKSMIQQCNKYKARKKTATHMNYEIPYNEMLPITNLYNSYKQFRKL